MDKKKFLDKISKMTPKEQEQRAKEMEALQEMKHRRKEIGELTQKLKQKQYDISLILEALDKLVLADQQEALKRFRKTRKGLTKRMLGKSSRSPPNQLGLYLGQPNVW